MNFLSLELYPIGSLRAKQNFYDIWVTLFLFLVAITAFPITVTLFPCYLLFHCIELILLLLRSYTGGSAEEIVSGSSIRWLFGPKVWQEASSATWNSWLISVLMTLDVHCATYWRPPSISNHHLVNLGGKTGFLKMYDYLWFRKEVGRFPRHNLNQDNLKSVG